MKLANLNITFSDSEDENEGSVLKDTEMARAMGICEVYAVRFQGAFGDRKAVSAIRDEMRMDEDFVELSSQIIEIAGDSQDWVSAIIRVEAKRSNREHAGRMEELRREKAARIEAEKKAEQDALSSMPSFGMF
jgi:hypothetical protein